MKTALTISLFVFTCFISSTAIATTYYVSGTTGNDSWDGRTTEWDGLHGPKRTIQAGIDVATEGDTVIVADGTYTGTGNWNLGFDGKGITLRCMNTPINTIIECEGATRGFFFHSGESSDAVVEGFTIRNGYTTESLGGGGILCYDYSSPTIINCIVINCTSAGIAGGAGHGGGISCVQYANPTIINCLITNNSATGYDTGHGAGIYCSGYSSPTIIKCTITNNSADRYG